MNEESSEISHTNCDRRMHFSDYLFYVGLRRYIAPLFGMYVLDFVILQGGLQFFFGAFLRNFNISSESSLPGALDI